MKRILSSSVAVATVAATLLSPMLASAAPFGIGADTNASTSGTVSAGVGANFCTNVSTWSSTVNDRLAKAKTSLDAREQTMGSDIAKRKEMRGQSLSDLRDEENRRRADVYAGLTAKATTDAQTAALTQFKITVDAAVQARRASVDAALETYWQGVDGILPARKTAVEKIEQDFAAAIQNALKSAASECAVGTTVLTVRSHFSANVKTALANFVLQRKAIDKAGPQVKVLVQARNAAVQKAIATYKATIEQARIKLKASFSADATQ